MAIETTSTAPYSTARISPLIPDGDSKTANEQEAAGLFGSDGLGFDDIIDAINPLHHIPIVSSIYRSITGDEISTASRLIGGAITGGPLGFAASLANSVIDGATGKDAGEHLLSLAKDATTGTDSSEAAIFAKYSEAKLTADNGEGFVYIANNQSQLQQQVNATSTISTPNRNIAGLEKLPLPKPNISPISAYNRAQVLSGLDKTLIDAKA